MVPGLAAATNTALARGPSRYALRISSFDLAQDRLCGLSCELALSERSEPNGPAKRLNLLGQRRPLWHQVARRFLRTEKVVRTLLLGKQFSLVQIPNGGGDQGYSLCP